MIPDFTPMKASIVIRTKNEEKRIGDVLNSLVEQTEKDFELIIVDSGSTDRTLPIIESFNQSLDLRIFKIASNDFTYPFACNFGAERARGDYLVFLSGHSIPRNKDWLKNGLLDFTQKNNIAGVYGTVLPSKDATLLEWFYYVPGFLEFRKKIANKKRMGILGNTNSIIRRDLWCDHHYDESYKDGGEDGEWAYFFINKGYNIIKDPQFAVYHSHGYWIKDTIRQYRHWKKVANKFINKYKID